MAKKIFVSKARLVRGERWIIDFSRFDPESGEEKRHRKDFDLNEIEDLQVRELVADRLIRYLDLLAPALPEKKQKEVDKTSIIDAVSCIVQIKQALPRSNSRKTYVSIFKKFSGWCTRMQYEKLPARQFEKKHCMAFWDELVASGKYTGRTLNNYLASLRTIWREMKNREMVSKNHFKKIALERVEEKARRPFTPDERRIVAKRIEETDYWLFRGLLLQFFCYVRPIELTRIRFKDFDFVRGVVCIREDVHKKYRKHYKTIPASIRHYFTDGTFEKAPTNCFVFGLAGTPGRQHIGPAMTPINENRMAKRHTKVLKQLQKEGKLRDISGLQWYSWKDTGISMHARKTTPLATKDQAGHRDLSITTMYYHQEEIIPEYQVLENDLF